MNKEKKITLVRVTTSPLSMKMFCQGLLKELSCDYNVVAVSSPGTDLDDVGASDGVNTIAVPMERNISIFKDIASLLNMIRLFRKLKPDIVHSMTPKAGLISMIAAWFAHVPIRIHTFTGLVWPTASGIKRRVLITTDKLTCTFATNIIPEGVGVMNDLAKSITKKKMRVLGYGNVKGIDTSKWKRENVSIEQVKSLKNSDYTFLFVGRLVNDKGIRELVRAFLQVNEQIPNTRLLLVGMRENDHDPLDTITDRAIDDNPAISECGPVFGDNLLAYYVASDCFVLPSYREGFPNTVIEAGSLGIPSIVTDINGSREIVTDGYNGLVVPPHDSGALYEAMLRMAGSPAGLFDEMRKNARNNIIEKFSQDYIRQCLKDYYRELVK